MQRPLDMEAIFPIKDAPSAALMAIKADCLRNAGVINDQEKHSFGLFQQGLAHAPDDAADRLASRRLRIDYLAGVIGADEAV
jgi:hypothetical protein